MEMEEILQYCCAKKEAYLDNPFGEIPICVKVHGRVFAQIYPKQEDYKITLKCEPALADFFRQQYPGTVVRGYHCPPVQQPHWNTMDPRKIPKPELIHMIDHAYFRVVSGLPKKVQKELLGQEQ